MKRIVVSILVLVVGISLVWWTYDFFSYSNLPETLSENINEGVFDQNYADQIQKAREHLKTIPNKLEVPSFSVAVGSKGKIIWSEAIGFHNVENEIPVTTESIYRIGSTSKSVTSTLAAKLYEKGIFDLDLEITDQIENYPAKNWPFTPRQLMSHTAGFPHYGDLKPHGLYSVSCNCEYYPTVTEALSIFNDADLLFEPGTDFEYSSLDMILLSAHLEDIANQDFLSLLDEEVFAPLNMSNSFGDHSDPKQAEAIKFYETKNGKYRPWKTWGIFPHDIDLSYKGAGGGIMSTPTDLVRMGNAIVSDSSFLREETKAIFFEPQTLNNGEVNEQLYALGWRSYKEYENEKFDETVWIVHHGGVSKGSMNLLVLFPDEELVINASINTRTEEFSYFWEEVMQLASFFL